MAIFYNSNEGLVQDTAVLGGTALLAVGTWCAITTQKHIIIVFYYDNYIDN